MKKNIFLLGLLSAGFWACKPNKPDGYTLSGEIKGIKDPYIYLHIPIGDSTKNDSVLLKDGHFEFKGSVAEPTMAYLATKERYMEVFLENADIHVIGHIDSVVDLKITGSVSQSGYDSLKASYAAITKQEEPLYEQYDSVSKKHDSAAEAAIEAQLETFRTQRRGKIMDYIRTHPQSPVSLYEISSMSISMDYPALEKLFTSLDTSTQNTVAGKKLAQRLAVLKKRSVGQPIMDFTQKDMNGKPIQFSQYNKGKYVLLDFWASWCGPCRGENPNVLKAYNHYKSKGLEILGVSLDDDSARWKKAIRDDKMPWTQVSDLKGWKNEVAQQYAIEAIPFNFLVDTNGIIIAKDLRGTELEQKLATLIK